MATGDLYDDGNPVSVSSTEDPTIDTNLGKKRTEEQFDDSDTSPTPTTTKWISKLRDSMKLTTDRGVKKLPGMKYLCFIYLDSYFCTCYDFS